MSIQSNDRDSRMKELADELVDLAACAYGAAGNCYDASPGCILQTNLREKETSISFTSTPSLIAEKRTATAAEIKKLLSWLPQVELFDSRVL